jgi:hypothetical protein
VIGCILLMTLGETAGAVTVLLLVGTQVVFLAGGGLERLRRPIHFGRFTIPLLVAVSATGLPLLGIAVMCDETFHWSGGGLMLAGYTLLACILTVLAALLAWFKSTQWSRYRSLWTLTLVPSTLGLLAATMGITFLNTFTYSGMFGGIGTVAGVAMGLLSAAWAVGNTGILLLLHGRYREECQDRRLCLSCDYDLTGTLAAGRSECPECGRAVPPQPISLTYRPPA